MTRERALKGVLVLVGLLFSAAVYPLLAMHLEEALRMMLSVYATHAGDFPAACISRPLRESQPDRFYGVVEFCSRRRYGRTAIL
jgi:hypothetical protein